jgi:hypothetical protein
MATSWLVVERREDGVELERFGHIIVVEPTEDPLAKTDLHALEGWTIG